MSRDEWTKDAVTIAGREVDVKLGRLRQEDLRFYPDNPRVHAVIHADEEEPSQAELLKRLSQMDHVKRLLQSVKANVGLTDPLIVRDGDLVVLEGNSRLAAYRMLARNDPVKWGMVKVKLLPRDIDEDLVFALLGEYHIIGRKDWAPYEQAGYLWRRQKYHGASPPKMAQELGLSAKEVSRLIEVYSFMVEHNDRDITRWSYYDELLRSNHVRRVRNARPEFDDVIVAKVKSGEIPRAVDVREKVVPICRAGGKTLTTFIEKHGSLEKCYDRAVSRGATNPWLKRLKNWREMICDPDTREDFETMKDEHRRKCVFELKKMQSGIGRLVSRFE